MRYDVTAIGETMLRLSVPVGERLSGPAGFEAHVGGAESNVLAALAALGRRCAYVSAVPASPLGERVIAALRGAGIDTAGVTRRAGSRLGIYFLEPGVPPRAAEVVYDRADSAASNVTEADAAWEILLDTRLMHMTGITPAIGVANREHAGRLLEHARERNVPVSFDVNFRSKLWSPADAATWIKGNAYGLEMLVCGRGDADTLFGLSGPDDRVLEELADLLGARTTVLTRRGEGAIALAAGERLEVPARSAVVVDRIGAGDAFTAGVLDGWLDGDIAAGLQRGATMGALALAQRGDMLDTTRAEVYAVMAASAGEAEVRR